MLPNNLADWPAATRRPHRTAAVAAGLVLLGGLIGIGVYQWVIPVDGGPQVNLAPTQVEEAAGGLAALTPEAVGLPNEDAIPIAESASPTPEINVSGLLGNQTESQNWAGYAAGGGGSTAVRARWTIPDLAFNSSPGVDALWVGIGGLRNPARHQPGTDQPVRTVCAD